MRIACCVVCALVVVVSLPLASALFNQSHADPEAVLLKQEFMLRLQQQGVHTQAVDVPWKRGWTQYWQDEFSGTSLDRTKWDYNYAWGRTHNHNGVMEERMVTVSGGQLHLRAENTRSSYAPGAKTVDGRWLTFDYTSGAIHSNNHFHMSNGYIEASVRFPSTKGFWPAAWMLSNGWPPEIDLVEHLTDIPSRTTYNYHYTGSNGATSTGGSSTGNSFESAFHIYGVEWNSGTSAPYIRFYLDNVMIGCCTFTSSYVSQATNMYMMFNLGVGGWAANPDGTTDWSKAVYDVDWVRVWRP